MAIETQTPTVREELKRRLRIADAALHIVGQNGTLSAAQAVYPDSTLTTLSTALVAAGVGAPVGPKFRNRDIFVTGDSRCNNGFSVVVSPQQLSLRNNGWGTMLGPETQGKVRVTHAKNGGVGGDTTAMWLARIPGIVSIGADVYVNLISVNDRGSAAMTLAQTQANMLAGLKLQADTGAVVVVIAEVPVTFLSGAQLAIHLAVRDWIKSYLPTLGYLVADPWVDMVDPASATQQPLAGMLVDDRHPSPAGAVLISKHVARQLEGLYFKPLALPTPALTTGWLTPNPLVAGTGGTLSGTANGSGTVAANSTVTGSSWTGATTVVAKEPNPNGGEYQLITLGGTPPAAAPFLTFHQLADLTQMSAGDLVRGLARIEYAALVGVAGVALELMVTKPSGVEYYKIADRYNPAYPVTTDRVRGVYETPQYTVDKTETEIRIRVAVYTQSNIAISGTVRIGQLAVQKIV